MESWHSYPSIFALGHRAVADIFTVPWYATEKIDGSQCSFGVDEEGKYLFRSKGEVIDTDGVTSSHMFYRGIESIREIKDQLTPDWTYRGEYLQKPKHNALTYNRIPNKHIILFDINDGLESFLSKNDVDLEADRLGLEVVPLISGGTSNLIPYLDDLKGWLNQESILGGVNIEGIVIKPVDYNLFGIDKKVLMCKYVSEAFKEVHRKSWKLENKNNKDVLQDLVFSYKTEARWLKSVQHLKEVGKLEGSPRDIGILIGAVVNDIKKECEEEIKDKLFKWAWKDLSTRMV